MAGTTHHPADGIHLDPAQQTIFNAIDCPQDQAGILDLLSRYKDILSLGLSDLGMLRERNTT